MNWKKLAYAAAMTLALVGGVVAAADTAAIVEAIKANPKLLDTPEAKKYLSDKTNANGGKGGEATLRGTVQTAPINVVDTNATDDANATGDAAGLELEEKKRKTEELRFLTHSPLKMESSEAYLDRLLTRQIKEKKQAELKRYGIEFFSNKNGLDLASLPVPEDYKIVPKDVLSVILYGPKSDNMSLSVDKDGSIVIPSFGPLQIGGLTFGEAKKAIADALMAAFPNVGVTVGIAQFSTIQVTLAGEVATPGLYNLSSFATVKEALIAAGGLSKNGSMRSVMIKRRGKTVATVDLYRIIRGTAGKTETLLQAGDAIVVPVIGKSVTINGEVKHPAIFEAKQGETLADLLAYAGGLSASANKNDIRISRYDAHEKVAILSVNVAQVSKTAVQDQDNVTVLELDKHNIKGITIYGNIIKPGFWPLAKEGMAVGEFFKREVKENSLRGVFLEETYFDHAIIRRIGKDLKEELIGFSLAKALKGEENITLYSRDELYILNRSLVQEKSVVKIEGECLLNPGEYKYFPKMTLRSLLATAGSDCLIDEGKITVISRDPQTLQKVVNIVSLNESPDFVLREFDEIRVIGFYTANPVKEASIKGEVFLPGTYPIGEKTFTLSQLIRAAGGMTDKASLDKIEIVRYEIVKGERVRKVQVVAPAVAMSENSPRIYPYDEVTVFRIPRWNERQSVTILGKVKYPGEYAIEDGDTLSSVLERAGGFMPSAYIDGAVFTREDLKKRQQEGIERQIKDLENRIMFVATQPTEAGQVAGDKAQLVQLLERIKEDVNQTQFIGRLAIRLDADLRRFKQSGGDITLKNGDTLYVPEKEDSVIVQGEVLNPNAVIYSPAYTFEDYIAKAGGIKNTGDTENMFVVHANGEAEPYRKSLFFTSAVNVGPGDVIVVPMQVKTFSGIQFAKDVTAILYQLAVSVAALNTIGAL